MSKSVSPLGVEIDEVALSVLGWEAVSCAVRIKTDVYDDCAFSEVAASIELRFHPDDWNVRHCRADGYVPNVVWQLRSRALGVLSNYTYVTIAESLKDVRAPKLQSEKSRKWETKKAPAADDLYVWVGAFDWTDLPTRMEPGTRFEDVSVEVVDHTALRGVRTEPVEVVARIRDKEELDVMVRSIHRIGTGEELMTAAADYSDWEVDTARPLDQQDDFEVFKPDMEIQVFDESRFLLDTYKASEEGVQVGKGGVIPRRPATSVVANSFDLDDLAGKPARVVIRLTDPVS